MYAAIQLCLNRLLLRQRFPGGIFIGIVCARQTMPVVATRETAGFGIAVEKIWDDGALLPNCAVFSRYSQRG